MDEDDYLLPSGTLIESGKDLDDLAAFFGIDRAAGESDESFRARLLSHIVGTNPQIPE